MTILAEDFCKKYCDKIISSFYDAYNQCYGIDQNDVFEKRTKSNIIADYTYENLKVALSQEPGIEFIQKSRCRRFIGFDSQLLIKVKKLSTSLKASNIKTISSENFNHQIDMELFPERATNVYLGYVMDKVSEEIGRIVIVCPDSKGDVDWFHDITGFHNIQTEIDFAPQPDSDLDRLDQQSPFRIRKKKDESGQ